jgi:cytochrome c oxidase cbb3-type subunit 3
MADFVSEFWSWFIIVLTLGGIAACFMLIKWMTVKVEPGKEVETMGHVWDEDLQEYNNPLPKWWLNMFYITLVFGIIYLILYPGLGTFAGVLGWTQTGQWEEEIRDADARFGPIYQQYASVDLEALSRDPEANAIGQRLFLNYCATCHGSDAGGTYGFPNLGDDDWLYGGEPETIKESILKGRNGVMPVLAAGLGGDEGVDQVAAYVLSLSGRKVDQELAAAGKTKFETVCAACHMPDGSGNQALGAPRLNDRIWLYGGSAGTVKATILNGRNGVMPAHGDFLGEDKVHLLAAYIYSLSAAE